jgi:hypothetical protein
MDEKEMFKKFSQVVITATQQGKTYLLTLTPVEITTLHGAVALTMRHPEVQEKLKGAQIILGNLREKLRLLMLGMGFTQEEVEWLDTKEV